MRIVFIVFILATVSIQVTAADYQTYVRPHAMFYYKFTPGGSTTRESHSSFGFRVDNIDHHLTRGVDYQRLLHRPAVFDFRMDRQGIEGIYISGIDYLDLYQVRRQNEEQTEGEGETPEDADSGKTVSEVIADMRSVAPLGVYIGVGLGIGLLLGAGD